MIWRSFSLVREMEEDCTTILPRTHMQIGEWYSELAKRRTSTGRQVEATD